MNARKTEWLVWGGLILTVGAITVAFLLSQLQKRGRQGQKLPILFSVPDFTLTNQNGQTISLDTLRGQVWVADIIFTRCQGPCPEMTRRLSELQDAVPASSPVKFVTLTTDPEFDSPSVLKAYAEGVGAQPGRWFFLTGDKSQIVRLAVEGLKLVSLEKKPEERESDVDLFIHSTLFVLVDKKGQARAVFESAEPDTKRRIAESIQVLLRER